MKKEEWFLEISEHLLTEKIPSEYFIRLIDENRFPDMNPFNMLLKLKEIDQSKKYHPEGNVWNHTMLVIDGAASVRELSKDQEAFMWGALLHDIGKITTTKIRKGRITAYNHDKEGAKLAKDFLKQCTDDEAFIDKVCKLVYWHMQPLYVSKNLPFSDIEKMKREISPVEVALFSICDRKGRGGKFNHSDLLIPVKDFLEKCHVKREDAKHVYALL